MARAAGPCKRAIIKDGKIVGWEVMKRPRKVNKIRQGTYVVWDNLCETTRAKGSLSDVAFYLYHHPEGDCQALFLTRKGLDNLNAAEKRYIRNYLET